MDQDHSCSSKWPRYALLTYATFSVLVGGGLIGAGVYFYKNGGDIQMLFENVLKGSTTEDFNTILFILISALVTGCTMIITSVTLAVCGAYRMNRSCTAAYLTFAIFGFVMVSAVGLVIVTNETQYLQDILDRSIQQEKDKAMLDLFTRMMMIVSLVLAAFQMIGIMLGCCLMKAIDDSKSPQ